MHHKSFSLSRRNASAALLMGMLLSQPASPAHAEVGALNCETTVAQMEDASAARDAEAARAIFIGAEHCDGTTREWLGRRAALLCHNESRSAAHSSTALTARLEGCQLLGKSWRLAADLADLAYERRDFAEAAKQYDNALSEIAKLPADAKSPEASVIEKLIKQGDQARLLADGFVKSSRAANGQVTGLGALSTRAVAPVRRQLPIGFEYNETRFTRDGKRAADELRDALNKECNGSVKLIGHTDERGSQLYNLKLSLERARAVVDYLKAGNVGQSGACILSYGGVGASEPFKLDDATQYTQEDRYRLDRRVEIVFGAKP